MVIGLPAGHTSEWRRESLIRNAASMIGCQDSGDVGQRSFRRSRLRARRGNTGQASSWMGQKLRLTKNDLHITPFSVRQMPQIITPS